MSDETKAPETQDTPQEKLLAGKYKSPEELEAAYQETVRMQSQLAEENDRMQRYIALMDQPPAARTEPETTPGTGEEDIPPAVKEYVRRELDARQQTVSKSIELENQFYTKNPDLLEEKDLVLFHTMKLRQEGRRMSIEQAMEEVARRTRAQIEKIRSAGRTPPHVEGGSRGAAPSSVKLPSPPETEEARLQEFISESRNRKTKHLGRG